MKNILFVLGIFLFNNAVCQINVNDLGKKTFYEVKSAFSIQPCEVTDNLIVTYCVEDGSRLSFLFKNRVLNGIMTMTAFSSQYGAEKVLDFEISKLKSELGIQPATVNGKTIFNTPESPIFTTFSVEYVNKTFYLVHYISKK
jgi:hypothetical protein